MRPAKGKACGSVLDNAGLWIEHGLSNIDREWTLEGAEKSAKGTVISNKVAGLDNDGILREIQAPFEGEGLELLELSEELERLLVFESFIRIAKQNNYKLISAVFRYSEYLGSQDQNYSDIEIEYCYKRLNKEGVNIKKGFWYHRKREIEEKYENKKRR